jgi:hypothetical protein
MVIMSAIRSKSKLNLDIETLLSRESTVYQRCNIRATELSAHVHCLRLCDLFNPPEERPGAESW